MFYVVRTENGKELLGSENQAIIKVKTIRGVKNYFSYPSIRKGTWNIYRMIYDRFYREDSFKFIKTITNQ